MRFDVVVVGGGIIGLATARALIRQARCSLALVEAENILAAHQTGNNSGVIHSGLYYPPRSLKAVNCVRGREWLFRYCADQGIPHERCGKLVVASDPAELPRLAELERRGRANGLRGLRRIAAERLVDYEPHAAGIAGLWVPQTGIVDFSRICQRFAEQVRGGGGEIHLGFQVKKICRKAEETVLLADNAELRCRYLINCAGIYSDRLARLAAIDPGLLIMPFRGEYYCLRPRRRELVRNLIYPVPDPRFPFLGVHFTRRVNHEVEAGPNAVLALKRLGYGRFSFSLKDFAEIVSYPGFWKMAGRHWRMGMGEYYRSFSKPAFVRALQRLIPEIVAADLLRGGSGVRAQALTANGTLVDDFVIRRGQRMIHVLNAPSPAATASLSIGATVAGLAIDDFNLAKRRVHGNG